MTREQTIKRDQTIDAAVKAGKFTAKRTGFWRKRWDADPAGTERVIGLMASGLTDPPVHVATENDIVAYFAGLPMRQEPEPPLAGEIVRELFGLRGVA